MKKSTFWTIIVIIIIVLLIIVAIVKSQSENSNGMATTTPTQTVVAPTMYFCDSGTITATFNQAANTASITLSDGRNFMLSQVVSADGGKYESGAGTTEDVVFWIKGNNAFFTENGKMTYSNCVAGTATDQGNGTSIFTDASKLFSFKYSQTFSVSGGDGSYTQDWRVGATTSGMVLAKVTIPQTFQPKTNFGDAKLTVGVSSDHDSLNSCLTASNGNPTQVANTLINGQNYAVLNFSDAGAGNIYDTTSFRIVRDNECYTIEYTIHSSNIENYPANSGITQFNRDSVRATLNNIVNTFTFLQ